MALVIAALLCGQTEAPDPQVKALTARGWMPADTLPCDPLRPGSYYQLETDSLSLEALYLGPGKVLLSRPLPAPPYSCLEIPAPQFIEEVL